MGYVDPAQEVLDEVNGVIASARERIAAFSPELVVLFAPDHYNGFFYDVMGPQWRSRLDREASLLGHSGCRIGGNDLVHAIADVLGIPASDVEGVATFYSQIFRQPVGRHVIRYCDSVVCHINGYQGIQAALEKKLNIHGTGGHAITRLMGGRSNMRYCDDVGH